MVFVSYDRTGNVLTADYAGEQTETNTYNELGLLTTVTTAEGDTLYQYDDASRLISVTQPNGETVSYTYDSHGNRATMTYPNGKTVKYTYDDMNRLIAVKGVDGATTKYSYDALGRRIATDGAKEDTVYAYDEVGNLVSQTTTGAYDLALEYAYDLSGRMTQESRTENGATLTSSYIYDALGQLTGFTRSDGQSETYTYDPVGNMTAKTKNGVSTTMRYNAANQLISSVSGTDRTTYTYDANGNLVRSENAGGARSYAYNALNLLQSFTREDGYTETYTYNANRLLSEIRTSEDLTTTLTWDILYGDGVVISAAQNGQTTSYTYGLERISAKTGSTRTEYVYDGRGSVAAEVSYNTAWYTFGGGLARKNVTTKSYTPFGEQIGEATSGFGYNGEYYNAATGMIYLRARFYEPEMNRFGQKDLLRGSAFAPQSLNRYLYVQNDPINFVDSNGRGLKSAWNTVKGAVVGAVKGAVTGATIGAAVGGVTGGIVGAVAGAVAGGIAGAISSKAQPSQPVNNTAPKVPANDSKPRTGIERTKDTLTRSQAQRDRGVLTEDGVNKSSNGAKKASTPNVVSKSLISEETPTVRSDTTYSCGLTERKQTPIRVIVYDKTEYDSELGKWVYQGFQNQAVNSPYFDYRDTNNVSMVYVKTAQEFIDAWNASDNVEQLYIYAHSGSGTRSGDGAMIFENQAISFNNDVFPDPDTKIDYTTYINYSYDHLNTINVDRIYLLSCHGAAYDLDHNIAVELAERSGAIVTANTGSVSFTERSGEYYARSGLSLSEWPVLGIWEQISVDEFGNAHWSLQEPLSSIGGDIK